MEVFHIVERSMGTNPNEKDKPFPIGQGPEDAKR
jgi:hypothetical protein